MEGPFDRWILERLSPETPLIWRVWRPKRPMIVLGRFSSPQKALRYPQPKIPVLRRLGGGGAVVLDSGCVVIELGFCSSKSRQALQGVQIAKEVLLRSLQALGIPAQLDTEWSDFRIGDQKIGGSTFYRAGNRILLGVSFVCSRSTVQKMEMYLASPEREPPYRKGRSHRDFVFPLETLGVTPERLSAALDQAGRQIQEKFSLLIEEEQQQ